MKLHELKYNDGARRNRNRVGRGTSSGNGKTSGRGQKGQTPLFMRLPKRGFTNHNAKEYAIINVEDLNKFENGAVVDLEAVMEAKLVKKALDGLKVLGRGELNVALTVKASKFSKSAVKAIEAAGGQTEVI